MQKLYSTVFLISLLLSSAAAFEVALERKEIAIENLPFNEAIYSTKVNYGTDDDHQDVHTVFDITSDLTWILEKTICNDCLDGKVEFKCQANEADCYFTENYGNTSSFGFGGQVQFSSPQGAGKNTYRIGRDSFEMADLEFKKVQVGFPQQILPNSASAPKQNLFSKAQASIGLGFSTDDESFLKTINNSKHGQVKTNKNEFSVFISEDICQFVFGSPNEFYKKEGAKWNTFANFRTNDIQSGNAYALRATDLTVGKTKFSLGVKDLDAVANKNPNSIVVQEAVFQTTSKFITFEDSSSLAQIVSLINKETGNTANCVEKGEKEYYYLCDNVDNFPELTLTLTDKYQSKDFVLKPEDYTETVTVGLDKKVVLLLRRGVYGYQNSQLSALGGSGGSYYIWLGYAFFNRYYVNFNYDRNEISIAERNHISLQYKHIKNNYWYPFLIVGSIFTLLSIAIILKNLKQVPFNRVLASNQQASNQYSTPKRHLTDSAGRMLRSGF